MEDHEKKLSLSIGRYIESYIQALVKRNFVALKINWPRLMKTAALQCRSQTKRPTEAGGSC